MRGNLSRRVRILGACCLLVVTAGTSEAFSQRQVEIAGYGGYQFWGGLSVVEGKLRINNAANWGASLSFYAEPNIRFEVSYFNQSTTITLTRAGTGVTTDLLDATIRYIQAGAIYEAFATRSVTPFGGLTAGLAVFDPGKQGISSEWRLAFGLNGGVKIYLSENFGFRGQGSLLIPIQWGSEGIFCGGGECSVTASGGSAILQGAITGGLFLDL